MKKYTIADIWGKETDVSVLENRQIRIPNEGKTFDDFFAEVRQGKVKILLTLPAVQQSADFVKKKLSPFFAGTGTSEFELIGFNEFIWLISPKNDQAYIESFKKFMANLIAEKKKEKRLQKTQQITNTFLAFGSLQLKK